MTVPGDLRGGERGDGSGDARTERVRLALASADASVRLRAALAVGTTPDPRWLDLVVQRCAVEPEFFVRDMLTWALTRFPAAVTVPRLLDVLHAPGAQARSQALHTLSKIGDPGGWPAITRALLTDPDEEIARAAWRAAVVLVPAGDEAALVRVLATQLGRGGRETRLSLSRALVALDGVVGPVLDAAMTDPDPGVRAHARATDRLRRDPDSGVGYAVDEARRVAIMGPTGQEE